MPKLPELPSHIIRSHRLAWINLSEAYRLTGGHLQWHKSPERRRKAAQLKRKPSPQPPINIFDASPPRLRRAPVEFDKNDPEVVDSIGIQETVSFGRERFECIAPDYFLMWAKMDGNSDNFVEWLEAIRELVIREISGLWNSKWHAEWFQRACRRKLHDALAPSIEEWSSKARDLEMQGLRDKTATRQDLGHNPQFLKILTEAKRVLGAKVEDTTEKKVDLTIATDGLLMAPPKLPGDEPPNGQENPNRFRPVVKLEDQATSSLAKNSRPWFRSGETIAASGKSMGTAEQDERARVRRAVVMPILERKRWKRGRWATEAGVGKNSVYEYLVGTRDLSRENRRAMAEALGLTPDDLPD